MTNAEDSLLCDMTDYHNNKEIFLFLGYCSCLVVTTRTSLKSKKARLYGRGH
uniref:Uncharacterized protein n=1 Tax=Arion vulgaris TaxID=1028688 RepID=A0A0B7ACG9_9EUPU